MEDCMRVTCQSTISSVEGPGLQPAWSVVHRSRNGIEVAVGGKRKMPQLTDASSRHLLSAGPTRRLLASSEDKYKYREVDGFLRLPGHRDRVNDQSYRSITQSQNETDSDMSESSSEEDESSGDESDTTSVTSLQATLKALEERLTADPSSIPTWLTLLSHTLSTVPPTTKNANRARAEIALSVLSRAIHAHPSNSHSRVLRLKHLKAGEEVWHESRLQFEWEDALKVGDIELWMEWLDWKIRRCEKGMEGLVEASGRVLRALDIGGKDIGKLRVFWRTAVGFRDAGYVEHAFALFQAQAELLYKMPQSVASMPFENQLDALEEFWESEIPRVGEPNAVGWAIWVASGRPEYVPKQSAAPKTMVPESADSYCQWAAAESFADHTHQLPSRSAEEGDDSDPYATILFSDVRPLLISLQSAYAKETFRLVWLSFLGLHIPGFSASLSESAADNADDRWAFSHLSSPAYMTSIFPADANVRLITADSQAGVLIGRERKYTSSFGPVKSWGYGAIGPWMREIFRHCRLGNDDASWDVLHFAFEAAANLKGATKVVKSTLATIPDSLPHWAAHARLERLRDRVDSARKVYQTVLSSSSSSRPGESLLWWDWAEMEWLAERPDAALQVLTSCAGARGATGIAILRTKQHLDEAVRQASAAQWKEREAWIKLKALLELLTVSPSSALSVFDSYLRALEAGTPDHESLTVVSLTLLYIHGTVLRNPTPPALLRERVEKAVDVYPSNTVILGIFLEAEKGQGIWGRVRAMLGDTVIDGMGKEKDVARRVAELWVAGWEKGRWEAEQERTRSGLSAAVQDERTRGSPILWRLYVEFEIKTGNLQRAKKLLFRAVGECPLVKELYLVAFGPLRSVFDRRELNEWGETMAERGLRMRKGLDEAVGELVGPDGDVKEEDNGGVEDEIEYNARELRRLRPY
ncbi:Protein NRDE2 [Grifola frondosa]|uniref:Protein NRDE2 n=1 Tax=Grifola frondosa TaxID=5627 RepID=A0A1C7MQL9_GRIFR|nr:Protein NRDE2 [Grifola frondosa]